MTDRQKRICAKYRARQPDGTVRCSDCPLVISHYHLMCRANSAYNRSTKEWEPMKKRMEAAE